MFNSKKFTEEEWQGILAHATSCFDKKYFTGLNFIAPETALPEKSIVVHFLHVDAEHMAHMASQVSARGTLLPRAGIYRTEPRYFLKDSFEKEYPNGRFFTTKGERLTKEEAKHAQVPIFVINPELDLIYEPSKDTLLEVITSIEKANKSGPDPWLDPVIIVRESKQKIPHFRTLPYASLKRDTEEFYTIFNERKKCNQFKRFLSKVCKEGKCPGNLSEDAIAFLPSKINPEFFAYMNRLLA